MAGRITETKYFDGCLNPITVYHHGVKYLVPCSRCAACLLRKSNEWNFRLSDAIDNFEFSIFFTLTYSNHYLPKVHVVFQNGLYWFDRDDKDLRFNGVCDVIRDDDLPFDGFVSSRCWPLIQNYFSCDYFGYSSKRDVQLWLKLVRRDIDKTFVETNLISKDDAKIRYYIISEYGPSTYRPHVHGVIFSRSREITDYLLWSCLYKNWKMCDKTLFDEYTHLCDNGASGYLSSYLTCSNSLPKVLKYKEFRPFRLSSKSPSLGFESFDRTEICENVSHGVIEYTKTIRRCDSSFLFRYSPLYMSRLFPKCYEYSLQSYPGLLRIYGRLYDETFRKGRSINEVSSRLRKSLRPIDFYCANVCFDYCIENETCPSVYLDLLDNYYYKKAMFALKYFYEWQASASPLDVLFSYINVLEYRSQYYLLGGYQRFVFATFLQGFAIDVLDFVSSSKYDTVYVSPLRLSYEHELSDVLQDMVKLKKVNEMSGNSPHSI